MDTVTYPDSQVAAFMDRHFIPVKILIKEKPDVAEAYGVAWTPTVVIADDQGKVHYRIEGYLPPQEFVGRLSLGAGKHYLDRKQYAQAEERFEEVAERHRGTEIGAEGLYWLGVARYKQSRDPAQLRPSWDRLAQEYPNSEWTKRAQIPKQQPKS